MTLYQVRINSSLVKGEKDFKYLASWNKVIFPCRTCLAFFKVNNVLAAFLLEIVGVCVISKNSQLPTKLKEVVFVWAPTLYQALLNTLCMLLHIIIKIALKYVMSTLLWYLRTSGVWSQLTFWVYFSQICTIGLFHPNWTICHSQNIHTLDFSYLWLLFCSQCVSVCEQ